MPSDFGAIRVKPLQLVLEGGDPVEYLYDLLNKEGGALLYVRTPDGFRCDYWKEFSAVGPLGFKGASKAKIERGAIENDRFPSYMRLDRKQLQALLARGTVNLDAFNAGGLFLRLKENRAPSIDFVALFAILSVKLEPTSRGIGYATPTAFDPAKGHSMVVKSFDERSKGYSYGLHGVSFKDLFIGTEAPVESKTSPVVLMDDEMPDDPYNLKESSPLMYAILAKAFEWRERRPSQIIIYKSAREFEPFNDGFEKNPKPFQDGRDQFSVKLAGRKSERKEKQPRGDRIISEQVPDDGFLKQPYIGELFSRALYAACRWSDAMEPSLGHDPVRLRDLLCRLGFWDYEDAGEVSSLLFFITGEKHSREGKLDFHHV